MTKSVITVEKLSKRYLLGHRTQTGGRYQYTALRDVIGREIRNFSRKATDLIRGRQIVQGDEVEEFWALRDVDLEVKQGEIVGIIGRNGAGKSTLLKVLSRITEPTSGRVALRGRVASLLEVGTGFHPELTGRENVFLNGAVLGMTQREIRRKFDEIVAFAEVERFLDTPVKHYSSGMYVRLAFAVAAHLEPEILIVDEVLAVGDAEFQKKSLGKMNEVSRQEGRTVLFVSHNHAAVRSLCSHGIVLRNGVASPKCEAIAALESYVSDRQGLAMSSWNRPKNFPKPGVHFNSIDVKLDGRQPKQILNCQAVVESEESASEVSLAILITDQSTARIMQVIPRPDNFIGGAPGVYRVDVSIELPPLIPGFYSLTFWLGLHHAATIDWITDAVTIEIVDSPDPAITFPYSRDNGPIAPRSRAEVVRISK